MYVSLMPMPMATGPGYWPDTWVFDAVLAMAAIVSAVFAVVAIRTVGGGLRTWMIITAELGVISAIGYYLLPFDWSWALIYVAPGFFALAAILFAAQSIIWFRADE